MIIDELQLPEKFLLSQTCRAMRELLTSHCHEAINQLEDETQKQGFLSTIAFVQPSKFYCEVCIALHPIHRKDTPSTVDIPSCSWLQRLDGRAARGPAWGYNIEYFLRHHHIQAALKMAARTPHARYLRDILQRHCSSVDWDPFLLTFSIKPRIANGQFHLRSKTTAMSVAGLLSRSNYPRLSICPHLRLFPGTRPLPSCTSRELYTFLRVPHTEGTRQRAVFHSAGQLLYGRRNTRRTWNGACASCPTKYRIELSRDLMSVTVHVSQNLGCPVSPDDPSWTAVMGREADLMLMCGRRRMLSTSAPQATPTNHDTTV
jgi:hypothetical protein